jgi:hypothetical protein
MPGSGHPLPGKDPLDLFDPSKPEYAGTPESLTRYRPTVREALEQNAQQRPPAAASGGDAATPPVLPRLPGETPADYLRRTNAPSPQAPLRVPVSR